MPESARAVFVTGGGQGIGRKICHDLASRGYRVFVGDINGKGASDVAEEIRAAGGVADGLTVDVADAGQCAGAREFVASKVDGLFGLVNDAAVFATLQMRPFWEIPESEWNQVLSVNLTGVWLMTRELLPLLRNRAPGSAIVNISAAAVWTGRPYYAHYVSSKAGVIGLSRSMAKELGDLGIRVNVVTPGSVVTEIERVTVTPAQRLAIINSQALKHAAEPSDIVGVVAFLLSDDSRFMTGQTLNVDGGQVMH